MYGLVVFYLCGLPKNKDETNKKISEQKRHFGFLSFYLFYSSIRTLFSLDIFSCLCIVHRPYQTLYCISVSSIFGVVASSYISVSFQSNWSERVNISIVDVFSVCRIKTKFLHIYDCLYRLHVFPMSYFILYVYSSRCSQKEKYILINILTTMSMTTPTKRKYFQSFPLAFFVLFRYQKSFDTTVPGERE